VRARVSDDSLMFTRPFGRAVVFVGYGDDSRPRPIPYPIPENARLAGLIMLGVSRDSSSGRPSYGRCFCMPRIVIIGCCTNSSLQGRATKTFQVGAPSRSRRSSSRLKTPIDSARMIWAARGFSRLLWLLANRPLLNRRIRYKVN
jgi:hypothetical protein